MKHKLFIFAIAISTFSLNLSAQKDSSGIYTTAADFQQGKLSYAINYTTEHHKINDNLIFDASTIKVKHHGTSYSLKKSETYGYRDVKGQDFRFIGNQAFKVLNRAGRVILYEYKSPVETKGSVSYIASYDFSTDIVAAPQMLTKENLKTAYPENHPFHDAIDATFKDDKELAGYDNFHKMYKLDHLLEMHGK